MLQNSKVNMEAAFSQIHDHWNPRIAAELNGQHVKLVKFKGEFVWHKHIEEDEMFYVVQGKFKIEFRDKTVELHEGEFIVVSRGIEHRPVADEEVSVMLFEPMTTINTGDQSGKLTRATLDEV
jgi:mannose-6-phosphate isomerase-like protein (cupin superfamily)